MTASVEQVDIAIVGGGMVGASLAALLAASQPRWRIALIEAKPLPGKANFIPQVDARSTAISFGSSQILAQLGVWSAIATHATAIHRVHVSDRGHLAGSVIDAEREEVPALGYVVENAWLGQQLAASVRAHPNILCFAPAQLARCQPGANGWHLTICRETEEFKLNARLAVIADGGDSPLRHSLGIAAQICDYGQTAVIANVEFSEPHQGVAYERFTPDGPLALLPLGESPRARRAALVWTLPHSAAAALKVAPGAEFLAQLQTRFGYRLGRFEAVGERQAYPLQLITAEEQVRSGLVLVGNAAHFLHPVAGQGFNLALRDCAALVETLAVADAQGRSPGDLSVLQAYLEAQSRDQALTIGFSDRLVRLFSSQSLPLIALRHLGLLSLELVPPLKQLLTRQTLGQGGRAYRWQAGREL